MKEPFDKPFEAFREPCSSASFPASPPDSRIVTTSSSPFASAASASAPHTARSTTASAQAIACGPSALAIQASTAPRATCAASKSTSAHCTYAMPRPWHRARVSATVASGSVPSAINKPPRAELPLAKTSRTQRRFASTTSAREEAREETDCTDWCRSPPVLYASSSPSIASTTGANAAATARALACAGETAAAASASAAAARRRRASSRTAASFAALASANASFARAWSPRRTAASPFAMSAAGERVPRPPSRGDADKRGFAFSFAIHLEPASVAASASAPSTAGSILGTPSGARAWTVNHSQSRPAHSLTRAATASASAEAAGETKSARRDGDGPAKEPLRCATRDASIGALGADVRGDDTTSPGLRWRSPERVIARGGAPGALPPPTDDRNGSVRLEARGGVRRGASWQRRPRCRTSPR